MVRPVEDVVEVQDRRSGRRGASRDRPGARGPRGFPADALWLSYLALYLTPWITSAPLTRSWPASIVGTIAFLVVYGSSYRVSPTRLLPHVIATALIGFVLAWFGGVWNVFNVLAASIAARLEPRRTALVVIALLQLALFAYGAVLRLPPVAWASGLYFGILAAGTTMLLVDLDRRNRELRDAQEEVRRLTVAAERERIARDLHDLLGRTLTAIALKANLARRLSGPDPARAGLEIGEVAAAAREALSEVRSAVTGIAGRGLADEAVRSRAMLEDAGLKPTIRMDAPAGLDHRRETALAMVLREAVTNVVRHAAATECIVEHFRGADGGHVLRVTDDGRGGVVEGFGIAGMRRRVADVGGTLAIGSGGRGTTVEILLMGGAI